VCSLTTSVLVGSPGPPTTRIGMLVLPTACMRNLESSLRFRLTPTPPIDAEISNQGERENASPKDAEDVVCARAGAAPPRDEHLSIVINEIVDDISCVSAPNLDSAVIAAR
jgi:hypothetical protein